MYTAIKPAKAGKFKGGTNLNFGAEERRRRLGKMSPKVPGVDPRRRRRAVRLLRRARSRASRQPSRTIELTEGAGERAPPRAFETSRCPSV